MHTPAAATALRQEKHFHQSAVKIDGIHTEFLTCEYGDRLWILVTQTNKPGTVTLAESERPAEDQLMTMMMAMSTSPHQSDNNNNNDHVEEREDMAIYEIETLFGGKSKKRDWQEEEGDFGALRIDFEQILSRQLLQLVASDEHCVRRKLFAKPILLFLGLQKSFEDQILRKTERGKDYMKLLVDFTRQTLIA